MNWIFTRPGRVRFEKNEPFCFLTLVQSQPLDAVEPVKRSLASDLPLSRQYEAWRDSRDAFNKSLNNQEPGAMREAWQRFYFKGEVPQDLGKAPPTHTNKRRLKPPRLGR
jgi:hypothetical protein